MRDGLIELGIDALVSSTTSGWRKHSVDISHSSEYKNWVFNKIDLYSKPFRLLNRFKGYDVIQFIDYSVFVKRFGINDYVVRKLIKKNKKSFVLNTGCDTLINQYYANIKNKICISCLELDQKREKCSLTKKSEVKRLEKLLPLYNGVIPTSYEYSESYIQAKVANKVLPALPTPINLEHIKFAENKVKNKIVIFHGINRVGFKGTHIIKPALEIIEKKYPNKVKIIINDRMPYKQYIEAVKVTNIVIDQTFNAGLSMNALISMAMGKVVFCGDVSKTLDLYNIKEKSPTISIKPSIKDIVDKISYLIDQDIEIKFLGYTSREFVKKYFDHVTVAKQYLKVWNQN